MKRRVKMNEQKERVVESRRGSTCLVGLAIGDIVLHYMICY